MRPLGPSIACQARRTTVQLSSLPAFRLSKKTFHADVYYYGMTLWELLTWQLPWGPANPWQLVSHVLAGGRPEVLPREALPGPDTAAFAGLDEYVALMQ